VPLIGFALSTLAYGTLSAGAGVGLIERMNLELNLTPANAIKSATFFATRASK